MEAALIREYGDSLPAVDNLNDLVVELRKEFDRDEVNIEYVEYLLKSYKSNPADWKKYAKFDIHKYTRNLVDTGNGKYNLILLCWGEGHGSAIHDHANSNCFMKMLDGALAEIRFAWPEHDGDELKEIGKTLLETNSVCYMHDKLGLHRVENVSHSEKAVSLHLYCPAYDKCSVFNQRTGQKSTSTVTFWSLYGKRQRDLEEQRKPEDN